MRIFEFLKLNKSKKTEVKEKPSAFLGSNYTGNHLFSLSFDGEKNLGEIGPIKDYTIDHEALRLRSWQAYLESEIAQTVVNKYVKWTIGVGLKLQAEPNKVILESEGISIDNIRKFTELVEARFGVYSKSKMSDFSNMTSLNDIAYKAKLNAVIAGDVLVITRYVNNTPKFQLVDSAHVCNPFLLSEHFINAQNNGNKIISGIEVSATGEHLAFYIKKSIFEVERIEAKSKATGLVTAFMVYGLQYRLDSVRGIPLITVVMEKLKKMERYSEAVLGSAEERQKIAYTIEHGVHSTGENPLSSQMAKAMNVNYQDDVPTDVYGAKLAATVAATTNKQTFNMPPDAKLTALESRNELHFKDFYSVNIDLVCAALGIPPNVAMSKYDSNFSASRAALKDWEYTLIVDRNAFSRQFYQNVYAYWLETEILKNKIQALGYLQARASKNEMVVEAYRSVRWVGANVPHIDPVKEVSAERLKLGITGASLPLTTLEAATEAVNGGDSNSNIDQYANELELSKQLKIEVAPIVQAPINP